MTSDPTLDELARSLRADGLSLDDTLARLRESGASIIDCLKTVRAVEGIPLGEAKLIVDASPAWASHREGNRRLREQVLTEVERWQRDGTP